MKLYNLCSLALFVISVIAIGVPKVPPGSIRPISHPPGSGRNPAPSRLRVPENNQQDTPVPKLQVGLDPLQVFPAVASSGGVFTKFKLAKSTEQNPGFTIELVNRVSRWTLYTNVRLRTNQVAFMELSRTNATVGETYILQTIGYGYKPPVYWNSEEFVYAAPSDVTSQSVDEDSDEEISELELADDSEESTSSIRPSPSTRSPSPTRSPSTTYDSSDVDSLSMSAGTMVCGLVIAMLYAMI